MRNEKSKENETKKIKILTRVHEVLLQKLCLVEGCLLPGREKCGLGNNLINHTDLGGEIILNQIGDEVAADEANSSKNQHAGLAHCIGR